MPPNLPRSSLVIALKALERYLAYLFIGPFNWIADDLPTPVGKHIYDSTIRYVFYVVMSLPAIYGLLFASALVVRGFSVQTAFDVLITHEAALIQVLVWGAMVVQQSWVYVSVVIIGYYTVTGLFRYTTMDRIEYRTFRQPKPEYQWTHLLVRVVIAVSTWLFVIALVFIPAIVSGIPGGAWTTGLGLVSVTFLFLVFLRNKLSEKHENIPEHQKFAENEHKSFAYHLKHEDRGMDGFFLFVPILAVLGIWALTGVSLLALAFGLAVTRSVFTARSIRLTLYEDSDGWVTLNPNVRLWNTVARLPVAFGLAGLVAIGLSDMVVSGLWTVFLIPLGVALGYLGLRYWNLGQLMYYCLPQSIYNPDERDLKNHPSILVMQYKTFGPEGLKAMNPLTQRQNKIKRVGDALSELNELLKQTTIPRMNRQAVYKLEKDRTASYNIRRIKLDWAEEELARVRRSIETETTGSVRTSLTEQVDAAEAMLEEAQALNDEIGREFGDGITNLLTRKSKFECFNRKHDSDPSTKED
jgi:hypothetical protein